jgi:hypothetical protein
MCLWGDERWFLFGWRRASIIVVRGDERWLLLGLRRASIIVVFTVVFGSEYHSCQGRRALAFAWWWRASIILVRGDQRLLLLGWWRASIILVGGYQRLFLGLGASIIHQRLLSGVWIENGVFLGGIARRFVFEIPMVALEQGR